MALSWVIKMKLDSTGWWCRYDSHLVLLQLPYADINCQGDTVASLSSRRSAPTDATRELASSLPSQIADNINSQVADIVNSISRTTPTTPPSLGDILNDQTAQPPGSPKFSTAAKAGIGGGCAFLLIVVAALIFYLLFWRNRAKGTKTKIPSTAAEQNRNWRPKEKVVNTAPKPVYIRTADSPSPTHEQQIPEGWTSTGQPVEVESRPSHGRTVQGPGSLSTYDQTHGMQSRDHTYVHELSGQYGYFPGQ
jgi:hypothetical protein